MAVDGVSVVVGRVLPGSRAGKGGDGGIGGRAGDIDIVGSSNSVGGAGVEDVIDGRWSHHDAEDDHDHDDFESFVLTMGDIADPEELEERIKACAADHDILRVKGFVCVPGKDMRHVVPAVGARVQRYYDRPWADGEARRTELVIIGEVGLDQAAIGRALAGN